jgi:spermidine/putrescine transport system ATP-binding protein
VTHDQGEALTMSDRIAVMNKGNVLQVGTPVEIYERPGFRFVADFIGETNFLFGTVRGISDDEITVFLPDIGLEVNGLPQAKFIIGQSVIVSIRPEKIRLVDKSVDNQNFIPARVVNKIYIGSDTRIIIDAGKGVKLKVWEQNKISTLDPRAYHNIGQNLWAVLLPENTLVLPEE